MFAGRKLIAAGAVCVSLGLAAAGAVAGAESRDEGAEGADRRAKLELLERPGERLARSIELDRLRDRYDAVLEHAEEVGVAPRGDRIDRRTTPKRLRDAIERLRERIEDAEPAAGSAPSTSVASGTLEAIAACESGGDPTAVNPAGYYGKYQFDVGTWQSVGGTGNPAEASEAEQDMRAAMLYERAGASPWPVCGA